MKKKTKKVIGGLILTGLGALYLLNFTFGVVELIPDNLPFIGNIDEGIAGAMVYQGIAMLRG